MATAILFGLCVIFYMTFTLEAAKPYGERNYDDLIRQSYRNSRRYYGPINDDGSRRSRSEKPNIILIITDDQDELLGKRIKIIFHRHNKSTHSVHVLKPLHFRFQLKIF